MKINTTSLGVSSRKLTDLEVSDRYREMKRKEGEKSIPKGFEKEYKSLLIDDFLRNGRKEQSLGSINKLYDNTILRIGLIDDLRERGREVDRLLVFTKFQSLRLDLSLNLHISNHNGRDIIVLNNKVMTDIDLSNPNDKYTKLVIRLNEVSKQRKKLRDLSDNFVSMLEAGY